MYCVVYRFTLLDPAPANEDRFVQVWSGITDYLKRECGAAGSSLHRSGDGAFFAYARWPSRDVFEASSEHTPALEFVELRLDWADLVAPSEVIFAGEMAADLLSG